MNQPNGWSHITKALKAARHEQLWLVATASEPPPSERVLAAAVTFANRQAELAGFADAVHGIVAGRSSDGPAIYLRPASEDSAVLLWIDALNSYLSEERVPSSLRAVAKARLPSWAVDGERQLTSMVAYSVQDLASLSEQQRRSYWHVAPLDSRTIIRAAVAWARFDAALVFLKSDLFTSTDWVGQPGDILEQLLSPESRSGISYLAPKTRRVQRVMFSNLGQTYFSCQDAQMSWRERLDKLLEATIANADLIDVAFMRRSIPYCLSWLDFLAGGPQPPFVTESARIPIRRDLFTLYVPDAHGVQVLTGSHLSKANNLSAWNVRQVAADRYLVVANDLEAWFSAAHDQDFPQVLGEARKDFGDMIVTDEILSR